MSLRDMPIQRKLMAILLSTSGAVLLLTCVAFFAYEFLTFRQTILRQVSTLGEVIAANSTASLAFENQDDGEEVLSALRAEPQIVAASLYDKDGRLFSKYPVDAPDDAFPTAPDQDGFRFGQSRVTGFLPVVQRNNERLGTLYLESNMEAMYARFRRYAGIAALVLAASLLAAYLLSALLQKQISRPIVGLAGTAKAISERRDYSVRATKFGEDELGLLTDAFNQMLVRIQGHDTELQESLGRLHVAHEEISGLNRDLEQRVHQRTSELEIANRQMAQANTALQAAKEAAERASHAKSDFLSRMSHELRTPLNAILGFGQLLEMDAKTAEERDNIEQILKGGAHLLELINDVLDISRIEAGRLSISPEAVSLSEVLNDAVQLIRPLAANRKVRIEGGFTRTCTWHVLADRQRLKQVVLNLLSNAVKYNRAEGRVTLTCESAPGDRLRLKITDTGYGLAPTEIQRLFGAFERLDADRRDIEGTGLGLALSKRLVELMGGEIGVQSTINQGSTFWLELPLVASPLEQVEIPTAPLALTGHQTLARTLLYIEDNLSNLRLVERIMLQRPGIKLIPAMQGNLGLELAALHRPDLVLLDLNLPDMPGREVLRRLHGEEATHHCPVIVVSADATPGEIERMLAAGARAYITKPLDVKQFLKVLDECFEEVGRGIAPA